MRLTVVIGSQKKDIEVSPDDSLYSLFEKLNISDDEDYKLIFRDKAYEIASRRTFRKIGITNDCKLHIMNQAISGGQNEFSNLSEEFIRRDNVSSHNSSIPDWRIIGKGINLYGICQNNNCVAKGKQVIKHVNSKE